MTFDPHERLRREFALARTLSENCGNPAFLLAPDGTILDINQPMAASLGQPRDRLVGTRLWPHLAAGTEASRQMLIQHAIDQRRPQRHETFFCGRYYDWSLVPCLSEAGVVLGVAVMGTDITDRKRSEVEVQCQASLIGSLLDSTPDIVFYKDPRGTYLGCNPAAAKVLGRTKDQILGRTDYDLFDRPTADRFRAQDQRVLNSGIPGENEEWLTYADGRKVLVDILKTPYRGAAGEILGVLGIARDITDRKRTEEDLRQRAEELERLLDVVPVAVFVAKDRQCRTITGNRQANQFYEATGGENVSATAAPEIRRFFTPQGRELTPEELPMQLAASTNQEVRDSELRVRLPSGRQIFILGNAVPLRDDQGQVRGCIGAFLNITEPKHLEEQLRQAQKMEAVGQLAGGMAHEFNNILAALIMNLNLVQMFSTIVEAQDHLREIEALSRRAAELIKRLLAFSRQSILQFQPVDLGAAAWRQARMLIPLLGERYRIEVSHPDALPWVHADPVMLDQVLLNLCLNARDAMPSGGRLRLELETLDVGLDRLKTHPQARPGPFVCLAVSDTGCGMDAATLKRLFVPFFTTKPVGQGTGLGLAMAHGIVHQHQGWIDVSSHPGQGTTFRIFLPAVAPAPAATTAPRNHTPPTCHGTILLVEDEPTLRKAARQLLCRVGCRVLEATDATEALGLWRDHQTEIDLLYTDMIMPGAVSGLELAEQLRRQKPGLKVIISSGYTSDLREQELRSSTGFVFLHKPCELNELIAALQARPPA